MLRRFDAQVDAEPVTAEMRAESIAISRELARVNASPAAEAQRAYREANREKIAEAQRAYYEANREKIAEAQRAYREANREKIAEAQRDAIRDYRAEHSMSQAALGRRLGVSQRIISYYERAEVPVNLDIFAPMAGTELYDRLLEAANGI